MNGVYLEITFRRGHALAAYLYLKRRPGEKSFRAVKREPGLVIDYNDEGKPIGIEILSPHNVNLSAINAILQESGFSLLERQDLALLPAA